jgi:adenine phosphoribosyltransferase
MDLDFVKSLIPEYPDFPKKGVVFRDIHPIMQNYEARQYLENLLYERYKDLNVDIVVGLESRGYYFGIPLANRLGKPFVPLRKKGKLPGDLISFSYDTEYSTDTIEVQKSSIPAGSRVIIIDDLLATGGTAWAAVTLMRSCGAEVVELHCQMELIELGGRYKLPQDVKFYTFFQF